MYRSRGPRRAYSFGDLLIRVSGSYYGITGKRFRSGLLEFDRLTPFLGASRFKVAGVLVQQGDPTLVNAKTLPILAAAKSHSPRQKGIYNNASCEILASRPLTQTLSSLRITRTNLLHARPKSDV
jgi:hypothetical protein